MKKKEKEGARVRWHKRKEWIRRARERKMRKKTRKGTAGMKKKANGQKADDDDNKDN